MIKAWVSIWKNTFCYTGRTGIKEYWLGLWGNVIFMYLAIIPVGLCLRFLGKDAMVPVFAVFMTVVHLPVLSLYFRRARDAGSTGAVALFYGIFTPGLSTILYGLCRSQEKVTRPNLIMMLLALSFGFYLYGSILGLLLYGDVLAMPGMAFAGLGLGSAILIGYGICHWRKVLEVLSGRG